MHFLFCGEDGVMPRKFYQETKDKTVRLVLDHMRRYSPDWAAIRAVAERSGMAPETLRSWMRDSGKGQALATERAQGPRWKSYPYAELLARDKVNLDLTWLRDESHENIDNLPAPHIIARNIVEDLTAALAEFEAITTALETGVARR
jgi:transposase-like protein